jgi:hypothetical protein
MAVGYWTCRDGDGSGLLQVTSTAMERPIWHNATTGQTYDWFMNGSAIIEQGFLLSDLNWRVFWGAQ